MTLLIYDYIFCSLGQVHRATLRDTRDVVAVKVQRPFLRKIYDQDLELLTTLAKWMDKMPSQSKNVGGIASSWTNIFQDAEEILYRESNYNCLLQKIFYSISSQGSDSLTI